MPIPGVQDPGTSTSEYRPRGQLSRSAHVLAHRTVQNHVQNMPGKLRLHNRVELVRYAIEHGLADEP